MIWYIQEAVYKQAEHYSFATFQAGRPGSGWWYALSCSYKGWCCLHYWSQWWSSPGKEDWCRHISRLCLNSMYSVDCLCQHYCLAVEWMTMIEVHAMANPFYTSRECSRSCHATHLHGYKKMMRMGSETDVTLQTLLCTRMLRGRLEMHSNGARLKFLQSMEKSSRSPQVCLSWIVSTE